MTPFREEAGDHRRQARVEGDLEGQPLAGQRMMDDQAPGVQREPVESPLRSVASVLAAVAEARARLACTAESGPKSNSRGSS